MALEGRWNIHGQLAQSWVLSPYGSGMMRAAAAVAEAPVAELSPELAGKKYGNKGRDRWNDSYYPTGEDAAAVHKPWYIIDAEGQTLGRLAVLAAHYVRCVSPSLRRFTPTLDLLRICRLVLMLVLLVASLFDPGCHL